MRSRKSALALGSAVAASCLALALGAATRGGSGAAWAQPGEGAPDQLAAPNWINVKDYGAVGDGEADDTEALQRAIDSAYIEADFNPRHYNPRFGPGKTPEGRNRYWAGTVYIPTGVYRTSQPLRLHGYTAIVGDPVAKPIILSSAKAALVSWEGEWDEEQVDWEGSGKWSTGSDREHAETGAKWCCNVTLRNLDVRGEDFGFHTLQVHTSGLHIDNCRMQGSKAGLVSTGFMMFSRIEFSNFHPAMWFLEEEGEHTPRFNTSVIRDCCIHAGWSEEPTDEWCLVLKGCVQSVKVENLTLERAARGILVDAHTNGVSLAFDGIWSFDSHYPDAPCELFRVEAAEGISISNVMGLDWPATMTLVKGRVNGVRLDNILAEQIDANGVDVVAFNCPPISDPGPGSIIDGERQSETQLEE